MVAETENYGPVVTKLQEFKKNYIESKDKIGEEVLFQIDDARNKIGEKGKQLNTIEEKLVKIYNEDISQKVKKITDDVHCFESEPARLKRREQERERIVEERIEEERIKEKEKLIQKEKKKASTASASKKSSSKKK